MTDKDKIRAAELRGERKAYLAINGWEGMTDEEVTWFYNYCGANGFRSKFNFHPTLEYIRTLKAADEKCNILN